MSSTSDLLSWDLSNSITRSFWPHGWDYQFAFQTFHASTEKLDGDF